MDTRDRERLFSVPPREWLFKTKSGRRLVGVTLAATVVLGVNNKLHSPDDEAATSVKQEVVPIGTIKYERGWDRIRGLVDALPGIDIDNTSSISAIAERLSEERGYQILPEYLAAANAKLPEFSQRDEKGQLIDKIKIEKSKSPEINSIAVGPVYYGWDSVDEADESLKTLAYDWAVSVDYLRRLNPRFATLNPDTPLPIGTVLSVDDKKDLRFVKREMTKEEGSYNGMGNTAMVKKIDEINSPASGVGKAPDRPHDIGFFPILAGKKFSPEEIAAAFPTTAFIDVTATQIKEKEQKPEDKKDKKEKKPSPIERIKAKPETITPRLKSLQEATGIPAALKAKMTEQYRASRYIPAGVLAAQIRADVGFNEKTVSKLGEQVAEMNNLYVWVAQQQTAGRLKGDRLELTLQAHKWGKDNVLRIGRVAALKDVRAGHVPQEVVKYPRRVFNWADGFGYSRFKNYGAPKLQLDTKTDIKPGYRPKSYGSSGGFSPNLRRVYNATRSTWGYVDSFGGVGQGKTGHMKGSDHYIGHAGDIMLDPMKHNDNAYRQEEVANWLIANAAHFNIKYLIVNDQIWSYNRRGEGWRNYSTGKDQPQNKYEYTKAHDTHIHVSVY